MEGPAVENLQTDGRCHGDRTRSIINNLDSANMSAVIAAGGGYGQPRWYQHCSVGYSDLPVIFFLRILRLRLRA